MREFLPSLSSRTLARQEGPSDTAAEPAPNHHQFITCASVLGVLLPVAGLPRLACCTAGPK